MTQHRKRTYPPYRRKEWSRLGKTPSRLEKGRDLFLFRLYIVMVVGGAVTLLSFFHTETSEAFIRQVREAIAYQIPAEEWQEKKDALAVFLEERRLALPVLSTKEEQVFVPEEEGTP